MYHVFLLRGELFLVVTWHVIVVLTEKVVVFLKIVVIVFFDLSAGWAFLSGTSLVRHSVFALDLNY